MATTLVPGDVDLTSPDTFVPGVPHDYFRMMRNEHPIWYQDLGDGYGYWHLFKHGDIQRVSRDPARFISSRGFTMGQERMADQQNAPESSKLLIETDPPRHVKLRNLINKGFTPRRIATLEDHIREIARDIVNDVCEKGEVDFVEEIAAMLPLAVICEMLDVPKSDWKQMFDASNRAIGGADPEYAAGAEGDPASQMFLFGYFTQIMARKKENPGDDLVSVLINAEIDGEKLTDEEILRFCFLLIIAGNETTRNATSHGMLTLMQHPEQRERLTKDLSLIPSAVEEILRWGSPVMHFIRTATEDVEIRGETVKAGQRVSMWYPSANRDEEVFEDPYTFDITRSPNDHIAFGYGEHFCLGANLARSELRIIFEELLRRLPDIELTGEPSRLRSNLISGIKHMPVKFTPTAKV